MKQLQDTLLRILNESGERIVTDLVARKLEEAGVELSARERLGLVKKLLSNDGRIVLQPWKFWERRELKVEFTNEDLREVEDRAKKLEQLVPELVEKVTPELGEAMLRDLRQRWKKDGREHRNDLHQFRKRLRDRWEVPLELLHMLLVMCTELGAGVNDDLSKDPNFKQRPHLIDALRRLHARACQITHEVLVLLESGHADGAMARWRTLHEIAVVGLFLAEHGDDAAERYIRHQTIESKRAAIEYQDCANSLGYAPLDDATVQQLREGFDELVLRYGKPFKEAYGWAAHHLNSPNPKFSDIQASVSEDAFRAHYRMASLNVHANPKGSFFRLGLAADAEILLAGPSNGGLVEPGQNTARSLSVITSIFCTLEPTLDINVSLFAINALVGDISEAFAEAYASLMADEAARREHEQRNSDGG